MVQSPQRTGFGAVCRLGQQHGEDRDALAVAARVGRLVVDRVVDERDEGFEQAFELEDEQPVGQGHGGLRGERLGKALVGLGERHDAPGAGLLGVDQLQHADDLALVALQGHGQEGLRAVARAAVERLGPGKIEALLAVRVGDVDRAVLQHRVGGHHGGVLAALRVAQEHGLERDLRAGRAAHGDTQRVGADDLELQRVLVRGVPAVERAAVGVGDLLGRDQDRLEQVVQVLLLRERDPDLVELGQPSDEGFISGGGAGRAGGEVHSVRMKESGEPVQC